MLKVLAKEQKKKLSKAFKMACPGLAFSYLSVTFSDVIALNNRLAALQINNSHQNSRRSPEWD